MLLIEANARVVPGVISTDDILPARYKHMFTEREKLAEYVFSIRNPEVAPQLRPESIILGTDTFGIGSSREQAVTALLGAGVLAVIAPRFGRIFFRNSWNLGMPAIELDTASIVGASYLKIDLRKGKLSADGRSFSFSPPPVRMIEILENGGLLSSLVRSRVDKERSPRKQVRGS